MYIRIEWNNGEDFDDEFTPHTTGEITVSQPEPNLPAVLRVMQQALWGMGFNYVEVLEAHKGKGMSNTSEEF